MCHAIPYRYLITQFISQHGNRPVLLQRGKCTERKLRNSATHHVIPVIRLFLGLRDEFI